jgi:hypothetical protein
MEWVAEKRAVEEGLEEARRLAVGADDRLDDVLRSLGDAVGE